MASPSPDAGLARLTVLRDEVEARFRSVDDWPCRKGCCACCERLAHMPELTEVEWQQVERGLEALVPAVRAEVEARCQAAVSTPTRVCPFLNRDDGACLIYAHRPIACRTYGLYISHGEGRWCEDIEALVSGPDAPAIVFGHEDALEHALHAVAGPSLSMRTWWDRRAASGPRAEPGSN